MKLSQKLATLVILGGISFSALVGNALAEEKSEIQQILDQKCGKDTDCIERNLKKICESVFFYGSKLVPLITPDNKPICAILLKDVKK